MTTIPIAFAFDSNLISPACICISSLLQNADPDSFFDIFILHPAVESFNKEKFARLESVYSNCSLNFIEVNDTFKGAFEIRDITTPTYYRLLLPSVIKKYDRIIYSDVDVIFRADISKAISYLGDNDLVAATYGIEMNCERQWMEYVRKLKNNGSPDYFQAGFIVLNLKKMREEGIDTEMIRLASQKFRFQDQDILNIACNGRISVLPAKYNMTTYSFIYLTNGDKKILERYLNCDNDELTKMSTIHYNGQKPWKGLCPNFDIWWEYYRRSPFFDEKYYFNFFYNKLDELDQLPLLKRIKILIRYFVYGRKKPIQ